MTTKNKKKILVVTGTRAEYGLLRSSMDAIASHQKLQLQLLVTGIHTLRAFGYTKKQIEKDGYHIDATVSVGERDDQLTSLSKEIEGIRKYCLKSRPDCMLVLGDRDEAFAGAIVAAHLNIPLAHIHGGDVTGPGVDESVRHSITKMAHVHFPGTQKSAARIKALGEEAWRINTFGSPVSDFIASETFLSRKEVAKRLHLDASREWLTVLQHPTAFDDAPLSTQIKETLTAVKSFSNHEKIVIYPNSDTGASVFVKEIQKVHGERFHVFTSLVREEYMSLLKESEALIGNSSSGIIESGLAGTPSIDIGEREAGRERGESVIHTGYFSGNIIVAIKRAIALKKKQKGKPFSSPYGKGKVGTRVAQTIAEVLSDPRLLHKKPALAK